MTFLSHSILEYKQKQGDLKRESPQKSPQHFSYSLGRNRNKIGVEFGKLEFDFFLAPGAEPDAIELAFEGAQEIHVDDLGDLVLTTGVGEIRHRKPAVYQESDGIKKGVAAEFVFSSKREVSFQVDDYDS